METTVLYYIRIIQGYIGLYWGSTGIMEKSFEHPHPKAVHYCTRNVIFPGNAGILGGWALQGHLVVGHCRDTLWLGTAGILCGLALQEYIAIEHGSQAPGGGRGQHRL